MSEKPEDLSLPLAVISRIINEAIPPNTVVSTEARKVLCKTASVFILYLTANAGAMSAKHNRKTMNANDVLEAIQDMDFPQFLEPLRRSLQHYREIQQKRKDSIASRKSEDVSKASTSAASGSPPAGSPPKKKSSPPGKKQQEATVSEVVTISDSDG